MSLQQVSLTETDLADVSAAFGTLSALSGLRSPDALQPHASAAIARLSRLLAAATSTPLRQAQIAAHKFELWEPCVRELSALCARVKPELGAVAARIAREGADAVGALSRAADELAAEAQGAHARERRAEDEVAALLQAAQLLESELQAQQQETRAAKDEVAALAARVASLEAAAAAASSSAATAAAAAAAASLSTPAVVPTLIAAAPSTATSSPSLPSAEFLALSASTTALAAVSMEASIALRQRLGLGSFAQTAAQAAPVGQGAISQPASPARPSAPSSPSAQADAQQQQQQQRIMPLKVLIADVEAIYASKARADQLAPAARETLEQHLCKYAKQTSPTPSS
jgi:hypothetical protein